MSKVLVKTINLELARNLDCSTSVYSYPANVPVNNFSIQSIFTGNTLAGTVSVQVTNDPGLDPTGNPANITGLGNWFSLSQYQQTVSGTTNSFFNVVDFNMAWVRVAYVRSSGTGTLDSVRLVYKIHCDD